jgi:adenosylmethionine-8-amino-7-oxononanoate aminotransferase
MEAAMKMARQYYMELNPKQSQRINFIGREGSYHGSTLGSLSMGGHVARRKLFDGMLLDNVHRVSAANEYRGKADGQTTEEYVQQLANELDRKFQELGPDTVAAFVCESLVGAVSIHSPGCSYLWLTLLHKRPLAQSLRLLDISKR